MIGSNLGTEGNNLSLLLIMIHFLIYSIAVLSPAYNSWNFVWYHYIAS